MRDRPISSVVATNASNSYHRRAFMFMFFYYCSDGTVINTIRFRLSLLLDFLRNYFLYRLTHNSSGYLALSDRLVLKRSALQGLKGQ